MKKSHNDQENFYKKIKNNKKYKAKIELIGYGVVIVLVIVYLNISNIANNTILNEQKSNDNISSEQESSSTETPKNFYEKINNNYAYSIDITLKIKQQEDLESTINYNGKSYQNNLIINKNIDNLTSTYYKIDDKYYEKKEENYIEIEQKTIYDISKENLIELETLKEFIKKSSLDHYTNYSSGQKEYLYVLKLRDLLPNYKEDKEIDFNVVTLNDTIKVNVDYTEFLKLANDDLVECTMEYIYSNINKVEEFSIINSTIDENN